MSSACNALGVSWLFALLAARLSFARGPADLAFLHGLLAASSAWTRLSVSDALHTQQQLLLGYSASSSPASSSSASSAASSPVAGRSRSAAAATASATATGVEHPESLKAVLNMHWFQRVAAAFPGYKLHLKRRATLLLPLSAPMTTSSTSASASGSASASAPQLQACAWLEAAPEGAAAHGAAAPAAPPSSSSSILWVRIYCELLFAQQLLQLASADDPAAPSSSASASSSASSSSPAAAPGPVAAAVAAAVTMDEALALWRRASYLPQALVVDFSSLSTAVQRRRGAELLGALVGAVAPALGGLSVSAAALEPRALLGVLAAAPHLAHVHLHAVLPFTSPASLEPLQLKLTCPHLKVTVE